jgi:hypothetical protein
MPADMDMAVAVCAAAVMEETKENDHMTVTDRRRPTWDWRNMQTEKEEVGCLQAAK